MPRKDGDSYPSEPSMIAQLLARVPVSGTVLEPAAGAGSLASPLRAAGLKVVTNDLHYGMMHWRCRICWTDNYTLLKHRGDTVGWATCSHCKETRNVSFGKLVNRTDYVCDHHMDATKIGFWTTVKGCNWIITNPPYDQLDAFLEMSLIHATVGVAMILRLSALEPAIKRVNRGAVLAHYADKMRFLMPFSDPRPSYTADGKTDSVTTAWFVWQHDFSWRSLGLDPPFQFITGWKSR